MYAIFVTLEVDPEHAEAFLEASTADAAGSVNREPGCLRFDIGRDPDLPGRFYFYEVYRDRRAFAAHEISPHFRLWKESVQKVLKTQPAILEMDTCLPLDDEWTPQQKLGQNRQTS